MLRRSVIADAAIFVEKGRVILGVAGSGTGVTTAGGSGRGTALEHQLGVVEGPGWLEATAAVLNLPSAVDAVAETTVTLRRVPLAEFRATLAAGPQEVQSVLADVARAHQIGRAHV